MWLNGAVDALIPGCMCAPLEILVRPCGRRPVLIDPSHHGRTNLAVIATGPLGRVLGSPVADSRYRKWPT